MVTKKDKTAIVTELRTVILEEIMEVRSDLTALEQQVSELESENMQAIQHSQSTDHATARQETVILHLHRPKRTTTSRGHREPSSPQGEKAYPTTLSFELKEAIMRATMPQTITFQDDSVFLYQDLSSLTLDACRAMWPLTRLLQEKRIPYKFSI
ncbi:Hypothetical predicted protein [Pelobates cultripes]|uniref:Uncharacterized protein n=1 Tax=Pelobates cultripes TaxID=61616 RepID=A0AAD1WEX4_PELCU|nr:Hypothetical predicted protein [Pelobates cultripes]